MLVKAIRMGFYDMRRRKEGSVFNIRNEKEFSKIWMEKNDTDKAPKNDEPIEPEVEDDFNDDDGVI